MGHPEMSGRWWRTDNGKCNRNGKSEMRGFFAALRMTDNPRMTTKDQGVEAG
jgi:hypothetical protein